MFISRLYSNYVVIYFFFFFFFLMIRRPPRSTLFLHDALPISELLRACAALAVEPDTSPARNERGRSIGAGSRSEEHTSELQSRRDLVCRLLLEKKKKIKTT